MSKKTAPLRTALGGRDPRPASRAGARVATAKKKPVAAPKKSAPKPAAKAPKPARPAPRPAPPSAKAKPAKAAAAPKTPAKPVAAKPVAAKPAVVAKPGAGKAAPGKAPAAKAPVAQSAAGKPAVAVSAVGKAAAPPAKAGAAKAPAVAAKAKAPAPAGAPGGGVPGKPAPAPAGAARVAKRPAAPPKPPAPKIPPEEMLLERAKRAVTLGDDEQAERLLEKMIVDFPEDPRGRCYLGNLKRRRGDDKAALEEYAKVLRKNPSEPTALLLKAEVHLAQKPEPDFPSAVAAYKKIVQALGRKKDDRSRDVVEKAKKQLRFCEARKLSLQSRRYLTSDDARQVKKGREILEKALETYPEDARNHMNLGVAHLLLDQPERAAALCRAAIDLNPAYARAHLMLGRALMKLKQLRSARDAFLKCIELDRSGRDAQDAWNDRREVERDLAKVRLTLFQALSGRPGADGEKVRLTLGQMKGMVAMLEGDPIDGADLTLDVRGHYALTAYSERHRYHFYPGPESLVVEHDGATAG